MEIQNPHRRNNSATQSFQVAAVVNKQTYKKIVHTAVEKYSETIYDGLCSNCINRFFCVWTENNKIYCEHYK